MDQAEKAQQIFETLVDAYGTPEREPCDNPVDELVWTILSANTNDANSGRAFHQLKARFGDDWDAVRSAPLDEIKEAIRTAGMYNQKAPHIVETLKRIRCDRGDYDLSHLADLPVEQALDYLTQLPGVGHKTASIVLLFCFGAATFPVDTHVQRITQRLGISPRRASAEKVKHLWEGLVPADTYYALHIDLIRHGRQLCKARDPRCEVCPLQSLCDYYSRAGDWA